MPLLILKDEDPKNFSSYKDMFKQLTKDDYLVEKIENGKLSLVHNDTNIEAQYGEIGKEDSLSPFSDEINDYRLSLREGLTNLIDLGIEVEPAQLERLKTVFSFLKSKEG